MADYRNAPSKFENAGINLVDPPESIAGPQFTRLKNTRTIREGVLEARQGTQPWAPEQKGYGPYAQPYPTHWDLGKLKQARYIGPIRNGSTQLDGFLTFHNAGSTAYRMFINGVPLLDASGDCPSLGYVYPAFQPYGLSVIRTTAQNGKPLVLIDGKRYVTLKQLDLNDPQATILALDFGDATDDVPAFYAYRLGITAPTTSPTIVSNSTAGELNANLTGANPYGWRYTYFSTKTGFESPPSPSSDTSEGGSGDVTDKQVVVSAVQSKDAQVDQIRWYRVGGTDISWRLIGTLNNFPCETMGAAALQFTDNNADVDIATAEGLDTESITPFTTIDIDGGVLTNQLFTYAFGPFVGKYVFWVGDPNKRGHIYWNKINDLGLTDPLLGYNAVTDPGEELINGFVFGGNPFVWSRLRLYALDYGGPDAIPEFTPREIPLGLGIAGRWAYAVGPNAIYFVGRDGIYSTSCQGEEPTSLTAGSIRPIFWGQYAGDLAPIDWEADQDLRLALAAFQLHFFYKGLDGLFYHLVADVQNGRWTEWTQGAYGFAYLIESVPWASTILGDTVDSSIYLFDNSYGESTEGFGVQVRTSSWDSGIPLTHKEFGAFMLDFDPGGSNIVITPYYNSETVVGTAFDTETWDDHDGRRIKTFSLGDVYARSIAFQFEWDETPENHPIIYQANLLFREDEEEIMHWEHPPTALGSGGWFHLKDAWFGIRSTGLVELAVTIDGYTTYYPIPSTNGVRDRVYVEFYPRLGKFFSFTLTGIPANPGGLPPTFRFYGEDSVLYGKPWVTGQSYKPMNPFTAAGYAEYLRKEGGT
jgi:hypothetical protein